MPFTWMLCIAEPPQYALVKPARPCFVAAYADDQRPPRNENSEQMLMILPLFCGIIFFAGLEA